MADMTDAEIEANTITATHSFASHCAYAGIPDTETVIKHLKGSKLVRVHVKYLPGMSMWAPPPAAVMRRWVDALLKDQDVKRDGPRMEVNAYFDGWKYNYYLKGKK